MECSRHSDRKGCFLADNDVLRVLDRGDHEEGCMVGIGLITANAVGISCGKDWTE